MTSEMLKMFSENKIGIDITGMSVTDPQVVELINILKECTSPAPYYRGSIENYFKELEDEHWEILVHDGDWLNAFRGYTADDWRAKHQTITIEEFLGKQMNIEENALMEMFN